MLGLIAGAVIYAAPCQPADICRFPVEACADRGTVGSRSNSPPTPAPNIYSNILSDCDICSVTKTTGCLGCPQLASTGDNV